MNEITFEIGRRTQKKDGFRHLVDMKDLDTIRDNSGISPQYEKCRVLAATSSDLRRATALGKFLPTAVLIELLIEALPKWRLPPMLSANDDAMWNALQTFEQKRLDNGWVLIAEFARHVSVSEVVAAVARMLDGHRQDSMSILSGPAGPGAIQDSPEHPLHNQAEPVYRHTELAALELYRPHLCQQARWERLPPIDNRSINPIGFRKLTDDQVATLTCTGRSLRIDSSRQTVLEVPRGTTITDVDIEALRQLQGVRVVTPDVKDCEWDFGHAIASLSAAGVPLLVDASPTWRELLGPELSATLVANSAMRLTNPLEREELSIIQRRLALQIFGANAWWENAVERRGRSVTTLSSVSVLLCTKRPEMIEFALTQIAQQRSATFEVILTLHGFTLEPAVARTLEKRYEFPLKVVEVSAATPFGDALNVAAKYASGAFIAKMDDDDWYSPRHLADGLLAHSYSGAELVGCAGEFVYIEPMNITVRRRRGRTETPAALTASGITIGATLLIKRSTFIDAGGFKSVSRFEDSELSSAVKAAGGRAYRYHGLNHLYRRSNPKNHTWSAPAEHFLTEVRTKWDGIFFNRIMERGRPDAE